MNRFDQIVGRRNGNRGFVFVTALGIMAIFLIIAASAHLSSVVSIRRSGDALYRAQASLAAQAALHSLSQDVALEANTALLDVNVGADRSRRLEVTVDRVETLNEDHAIYKSGLFDHQGGDRLITLNIRIHEADTIRYRVKNRYIWNANGRFERPLLFNLD